MLPQQLPVLDKIKEHKFDWEPYYLNMSEDFIFPNTFKTLREFCLFFSEERTKPEFEIYDAGMLNNLAFLLEKGTLAKSSAEQVEKIIRIGKEHGLEPATPNEAREILALKGIEEIGF